MRDIYLLLASLAAAAFLLQIEWLLFAALALLVALAIAEALGPTAPAMPKAAKGGAAQAPQQIIVYQPTAPPVGWFDAFMGVMMGKAVEKKQQEKQEKK